MRHFLIYQLLILLVLAGCTTKSNQPDSVVDQTAKNESTRLFFDVHDLEHMLRAVEPIVIPRQRARIHQPLPQRLVEDLVHQRALARSGRPRDCHQRAQRKGHVHALEIILPSPADLQYLPISLAPMLRLGDRPLRRLLAGRHRCA